MQVVLQAYHEMAHFLTKQGAMFTSKKLVPPEPPDLEELEGDLCSPIKKLKGLVQGAGLTEQVESLKPFCPSLEDQVATALYDHGAHVDGVRRGQTWLQNVVCPENLKAIAVTSQTWLCAIWAEEEVEITNSKADYIFADASAVDKLPDLPAQPSEAQLLELLEHLKGMYEAKPSKHVQGTSCCNSNPTYCLSVLAV